METTWHYLVNQFLNATKESYRKAIKLSNYHNAMLFKAMTDNPADPHWAMLYNSYNPLHLALTEAYSNWTNAGGSQEGQTLNKNQLKELLIKKINKWDINIQIVFDKDTPDYKTIFPNLHYPYNSGAIDTRILAVKTFSKALATYPALAAIKAEVDAFFPIINSGRTIQQGAKGGTKTFSKLVEKARVPAMVKQYADLGFLIYKLAETPLLIAPFFELEVLREHQQTKFTSTLAIGELKEVLAHTFLADEAILLKVTGKGPVVFYLGSKKGGKDSNPITVNSDEKEIILLSDFGINNYGTHRYLTAENQSGEITHYEVEINVKAA